MISTTLPPRTRTGARTGARIRTSRGITYASAQSAVLVVAFALSAVHTVDGSISGIGDPSFSATTPLAWIFYGASFVVAGLARRPERWLRWAVVGYLVLLLAVGIFYYPTIFGPRQQTVFGWFENDVYLGLLMIGTYLGVQNLRGVTLTADRR